MIEKIKVLCLSKTNIITFAISTFLFLKDFEEVATNLKEHRVIFAVCAVILFVMLLIHLFSSQKATSNKETTSASKLENNKINLKTRLKNSVPKLVFSSFLLLVILMIGVVFYLKNTGVYYVVLKKELTIQQAQQLNTSINGSKEFKRINLKTRILKMPNSNQFEVILEHGYFGKKHAEEKIDNILGLEMGFNPYIKGPQKVAGIRKLKKYFQDEYFK
jgi:hypothetical protein